jgi:hypothetical protein
MVAHQLAGGNQWPAWQLWERVSDNIHSAVTSSLACGAAHNETLRAGYIKKYWETVKGGCHELHSQE